MSLNPSRPKFTPRIVIHGGAGNITRQNLTPSARHTYLASIASILHHIHPLLSTGALTAAEAATLAVKLLEDNPLFNCARGAVFTLDGHIELEASLMISRGSFKRCAGVYLLKGVKNPILLARELLSRDGGGGDRERGEGHNCLSGAYAEGLAEKWGLEVVNEEYFWTRKRWEQHLADLKDGERKGGKTVKNMTFLDGEVLPRYSEKNSANSSYDGRTMDDDDEKWKGEEEEYLPKGTVGCVVLDADGVIAVATSTGGRTNKVPGRIGDTPTPGAGFWAEEWDAPPELRKRSRLRSLFSCLPFLNTSSSQTASTSLSISTKKAAGLSGTGNGDYFLRLAACHSIISLFKHTNTTLSSAAKKIVGPNGEMQKAAEGRKGEDFSGAVVGVDGEGNVIMEMNCGGCFRGTVDERGRVLVAAFADEELEVWREFNKVEG